MLNLSLHKRSDVTVHASRSTEPQPAVRIARWYNGNPVGGSAYDFTPEEAEQFAAMLTNAVAEARAPRETREEFEAYCNVTIGHFGPGTAASFTEWMNEGRPSTAWTPRELDQSEVEVWRARFKA